MISLFKATPLAPVYSWHPPTMGCVLTLVSLFALLVGVDCLTALAGPKLHLTARLAGGTSTRVPHGATAQFGGNKKQAPQRFTFDGRPPRDGPQPPSPVLFVAVPVGLFCAFIFWALAA
ncbi:hypothetical protein EMIHUDRAFT_239578 [Emiliania huxleyi CCMP1516]|uniref:Uncharacterized protein n=2 Tax=Emiliania huxleyi TaxID=2903 RepID=A0A0D3JJ03_EMIH1|nr:hypothetical protein EMIHUDRAFT_239578 [Emiliania huxleyi CCMP1516]EOD23488.1 hypothetical protein EMIHUDRAFT_239578 [Emiliania huxleyi CCMP1516]|eukprot:XP_005775917.1 hypothetical protein EMIHUDRAFT_239578 [Emiliania huxleyi CCMP1516]